MNSALVILAIVVLAAAVLYYFLADALTRDTRLTDGRALAVRLGLSVGLARMGVIILGQALVD